MYLDFLNYHLRFYIKFYRISMIQNRFLLNYIYKIKRFDIIFIKNKKVIYFYIFIFLD